MEDPTSQAFSHTGKLQSIAVSKYHQMSVFFCKTFAGHLGWILSRNTGHTFCAIAIGLETTYPKSGESGTQFLAS